MTTLSAVLTEAHRETIAQAFFHRSRTDDACVTCGTNHVKPANFRDAKSRREWKRSRMCQGCQDEVSE